MRFEQQEPIANSGFYRSVSAPQIATRLTLDADGQWKVSAEPDPKPSSVRRKRPRVGLQPSETPKTPTS